MADEKKSKTEKTEKTQEAAATEAEEKPVAKEEKAPEKEETKAGEAAKAEEANGADKDKAEVSDNKKAKETAGSEPAGEEKKPEGEEAKKEEEKPAEGEEKKEGEGEGEKKEAGSAEVKAEAGGEKESGEGEKKEESAEKETAGSEPAGEEKPKKKRFPLSLFGRKDKKAEEKKEEKQEKKEEVEVPQDEALAAVAEVEAKMANKIQNELMETSDQVVIKLSKSKLMLLLGILVLVMWAVPIARGAQMAIKSMNINVKWNLNIKLPWQAAPAAEKAETIKVRIRDVAGVAGKADEVAAVLKEAGYEFVEVQKDTESEADGMQVITKPDDEKIRSGLEAALATKYELASPSAQLTDDSDFDAVVVLGKESET